MTGRTRRVARRLVPSRVRQTFTRARHTPPRQPPESAFGVRAPTCPEGMVTGPPDFVGIGAPRAGTSWWFSLLTRYPGIQPAHGRKELDFLNRFMDREPSPEDVATYASWFPRPPGAIAGEFTPDYMVHCWLGPVLARMAPDAKVVVMLRDPVERYRSGIAHDLPSDSVHAAAEAQNLFRGLYAEHLARLDPYVADDAVLVLQYERCVREPHLELARTFRFLGVDPFEVSRDGARVSPPGALHEISPERRSLLVDAYRRDVERLAARYPEIDLSLWKNFA